MRIFFSAAATYNERTLGGGTTLSNNFFWTPGLEPRKSKKENKANTNTQTNKQFNKQFNKHIQIYHKTNKQINKHRNGYGYEPEVGYEPQWLSYEPQQYVRSAMSHKGLAMTRTQGLGYEPQRDRL